MIEVAMMGGGISGGYGGGFVGAGRINQDHGPGWAESIKKATGEELKERNIEPMPQKCNCIPHVVITALVVTIIAMIIWELT